MQLKRYFVRLHIDFVYGILVKKCPAYYLRMCDFEILFNRCLYNREIDKEFENVWNQRLRLFSFCRIF